MGLIVVPFRVSVAGIDVSDRLRPLLEELSVTDKAGTVSDTASVTLNDNGGSIVLPRRGADLTVALPSRGSLVEVFRGTVDDVRSKYDRGAGLKLLIEAKGMNTRDELKAPREKHWDDKDLASVMREVGELGGISIRVADVFASIRRDWWAMDGESIPAFCRRIAREVGGTFKIAGSIGILAARSGGVSANGAALATITARRGVNLLSADLAPEFGRPRFKKARARFYDLDQARYRSEDVEFEDGEGADQLVPELAADQDGASSAADAERKEAERSKGGGRVEIIGDAAATPEGTCQVSGIRAGVDGAYAIDSVGHGLTRQRGYVTALDLVKPGEGVGEDER